MSFRIPHTLEAHRLPHPISGDMGDSQCGFFIVQGRGLIKIIAVSGELEGSGGWDHVSVSAPGRCPTWEEMCWVKDKFWDAEDTVIQFHPPRSQYVNHHPYTLHLWRDLFANHRLPPSNFVGPK